MWITKRQLEDKLDIATRYLRNEIENAYALAEHDIAVLVKRVEVLEKRTFPADPEAPKNVKEVTKLRAPRTRAPRKT